MAVMKEFDVVPRDSPCDPVGIVLHGHGIQWRFTIPFDMDAWIGWYQRATINRRSR